jgi:hypothetical protein
VKQALVGLAIVVVSILFVSVLVVTLRPANPRNLPRSASSDAPSPSPSFSPAACHERDGLPDPTCTPGVTSIDVTQASLQSTICTSGYTSHGVRSDGRAVRPPTSVTEPLKVSGIRAYAYGDLSVADYEEDHLIPLELGGDGWDSANLWPEPRYGSHPAAQKDQVENELHRLVCAGRVSLASAQHAIATDWETAVTVAGSP